MIQTDNMFSAYTWPEFFLCAGMVVGLYYLVVGWIYREDLLRWLRAKMKK